MGEGLRPGMYQPTFLLLATFVLLSTSNSQSDRLRDMALNHYGLRIQAPKLNKMNNDWVTFKNTRES